MAQIAACMMSTPSLSQFFQIGKQEGRFGWVPKYSCLETSLRINSTYVQAKRKFDISSVSTKRNLMWSDLDREISHPFILTAQDSARCLCTSRKSEPLVASQKLCVAVDGDEALITFQWLFNIWTKDKATRSHIKCGVALSLVVCEVLSLIDGNCILNEIWNCSQDEANLRVHKFFESDHFICGITPIPGAHEALLQLQSFCHLVVVTSRQHVIQPITLEWLDQHFAGIFQEVHFGNHFALEGPSKPKSEMCRSLGVQVLIDDNPGDAMDC